MTAKETTASRQQAFTLVELSIVLVIIGLVVGGVLVGQGAVRASMLQKLITDKVMFETSFYAFQTKYGCIAGDCSNATDFFGTSTDCGNAMCKDLTASGGTCNGGNGNGIIESTASSYPNIYEALLLWNQLGLSGLIAGKYFGSYCGITSNNVPVSPLNNKSIWWGNTGVVVAGKTVFTVGKPTGQAWGASITASNAYSIDSKIDDGNPNGGRFRAREGYKPDQSGFYPDGCKSGNVYDVNQTEERCLISFVIR